LAEKGPFGFLDVGPFRRVVKKAIAETRRVIYEMHPYYRFEQELRKVARELAKEAKPR